MSHAKHLLIYFDFECLSRSPLVVNPEPQLKQLKLTLECFSMCPLNNFFWWNLPSQKSHSNPFELILLQFLRCRVKPSWRIKIIGQCGQVNHVWNSSGLLLHFGSNFVSLTVGIRFGLPSFSCFIAGRPSVGLGRINTNFSGGSSSTRLWFSSKFLFSIFICIIF